MAEYRPFTLERAFDAYEFKEDMRQLSCSDGEPVLLAELLALADAECRQLWDNLTMSYTQVGGHPLLLQELTTGAGCGVFQYGSRSVSQIVPAVPQECILLAMIALCDQIKAEDIQGGGTGGNFEAIVVWPSYQSLHETLRSRGVKLKLWNLKAASDTEWTFDLAELRALIGDRTRLLVVNFPHNPSGFAPSPEAWQELIRLCSANNMYLFSDEIYNSCSLKRQCLLPAVEPAANLYDRAVSMSGLSKCFGLPGLRLGWLVSQNDDLLRRVRQLKDYTTICVSAPVEILGLIAVRNSASLAGRVRDLVAENCQLARGFFVRHGRLFAWREPTAGTTALVEMLEPLLGRFNGSGVAFCRALTDRFNVFVVCSDMFQFTERYLRVGLGRRDLREVLALVEAALTELGLV